MASSEYSCSNLANQVVNSTIVTCSLVMYDSDGSQLLGVEQVLHITAHTPNIVYWVNHFLEMTVYFPLKVAASIATQAL